MNHAQNTKSMSAPAVVILLCLINPVKLMTVKWRGKTSESRHGNL